MLRPSMEDCLNLWFGKVEATDQDIWDRFGADVALASRGHYDHWALNVEHPRLLVALVIMLDQFRRNMYRETPQMYASDPRCLALVKRGLRVGVGGRLRPIERVFLCLALTHSEAMEDQHLCMEEWGRAMEELAPDDPLNALPRDLPPPRRGDHALRPVPAPQRDPAAGEHRGRGGVPRRTTRSASTCRWCGSPTARLAFAGTVRKRTRQAARPRIPDLAARHRRGARGPFEFEYAGPDAVFTTDAGPAEQAGLHPHRRQRARFHRPDQHGPDQLPRVHRQLLVRAVLAPGRLHPGLHHRTRGHGQARRTSGRSAAPRSSASASTAPRITSAGSPTSTRRSRPRSNFPIIADKDRRVVDAVRDARRDHLRPRRRASARR